MKKITLINSGGTISSDYDGMIMRPGLEIGRAHV